MNSEGSIFRLSKIRDSKLKREGDVSLLDKFEELTKKYPPHRGSLIPLLQEVQDFLGYISEQAVDKISDYLGISSSEIYGVASFYTQFKFNPPGRHIIQVCQGTACHVRGSKLLIDVIKEELGIEPGQTTADGEYTLERVACIGCCALAPAVVIDGRVYAQVTPGKIRELIKIKKEVSSEV